MSKIEYDWMSHSGMIRRGWNAERMWKNGWEMEGGAWRRPRDYCPYCKLRHDQPPHNDPDECDLWYDWCRCACAKFKEEKR